VGNMLLFALKMPYKRFVSLKSSGSRF